MAPYFQYTISTCTRTHLSPCTRVDSCNTSTTTLAATPARSELLIRIHRRKPQPNPLYTYTLTALTATPFNRSHLSRLFPIAASFLSTSYIRISWTYTICCGFSLKFFVEVRAAINLFHSLIYVYIYIYV